MTNSESITEIAAALAKAQSEILVAVKDSYNPHFKNKYADINNIIVAVRPALAAQGISIMQFPKVSETFVEIETRLLHASGQWISGFVSIPVPQNSAQGVGSAITYGRRYGLQSLLAVGTDDDDGDGADAAMRREEEKPMSDAGIKFKARLEDAAKESAATLKKVWASGSKDERYECQKVFGALKDVAEKSGA